MTELPTTGDRPHETTLTTEYDDTDSAAIVEAAISQEIGEIADDRAGVRVERDGAVLTVWIGADDLVGLRAGLNTWLTLIAVAERVVNAGERLDQTPSA